MRGISEMVATAAIACAVSGAGGQTTPVRAFAEDADRAQVQLAHDGRVVGFVAPRDGHPALLVQSLGGDALVGTPSLVGGAKSGPVMQWRFVPDERGAARAVACVFDARESGRAELHATSLVDASDQLLASGPRIEIVRTDRGHPFEVLARVTRADGSGSDVWRLDVRDGSGDIVFRDDERARDVLVDSAWLPRLIAVPDRDGGLEVRLRADASDAWRPSAKWPSADAEVSRLVRLSNDGEIAYLVDSTRESALDTGVLYAVNMRPAGGDQRWRALAASGRCEPGDVVFDEATGRAIGARFTHERPWIKALDAAFEEDVIAMRKLANGEMRLHGGSDDGSVLLASFAPEGASEEYWLVHRGRAGEAVRGTRLFAARDRAAPSESSERAVATIALRDGERMVVYFTAPRGYDTAAPRPVPTIVLLHDRGDGSADDRPAWGFDPLIDSLSASGYGTLSACARGTPGFGKRWRSAASLRAEDVLDAIEWGAAQRYVDPANIAIVAIGAGASTGAELLRSERWPMRCAVLVDAPSDLAARAADAGSTPILWSRAADAASKGREERDVATRVERVETPFRAARLLASERAALWGAIEAFLSRHFAAEALGVRAQDR